MAYIDETYGKQLEEALRGLVSRPALGQPWFGFHESEVPVGVLLFTATTHSRVLYADFWNYIQNKNLVKTEEEWQSIYSEQGWCPFYSDGDGIDTFRMPSAPLYLHGADTLSEAGQYIEAGLPNITGYFTGRPHTSGNTRYGGGLQGEVTGAFSWHVQGGIDTATGTAETSGTSYKIDKVSFDASRSNSIYGNSSTVTPETSKILFGVWAISAPQQPIPDATVEGIISELGVVSNNALEANIKAEEAIDGLNGVVRSVVISGDDGTSWYRKTSDGLIIQCVYFSHNNSMPKAISLPIPFRDTKFWAMTSDLSNIRFSMPIDEQTVLFQEGITSTTNYTLIALGY